MPKFDGFSAWITIGRRKVQEFNERVELEERSTICYVTSDTGKVMILFDSQSYVLVFARTDFCSNSRSIGEYRVERRRT